MPRQRKTRDLRVTLDNETIKALSAGLAPALTQRAQLDDVPQINRAGKTLSWYYNKADAAANQHYFSQILNPTPGRLIHLLGFQGGYIGTSPLAYSAWLVETSGVMSAAPMTVGLSYTSPESVWALNTAHVDYGKLVRVLGRLAFDCSMVSIPLQCGLLSEGHGIALEFGAGGAAIYAHGILYYRELRGRNN